MAKARGFGRKSTTEVDPAPTPAAAANQKARRTPRSRPASRPEGAATEKAARPTPASKRRSRVRAASPMRCTVSIRNPAMHMFVLSAVGTISSLAASRPWRAGVRFAADSALEGDGFELLVPRHKSRGFPQHSGHGGGWAGLLLKTAPPDCSVLLLRTGVERDRSRWRAGALRIVRLDGDGRKFRRQRVATRLGF